MHDEAVRAWLSARSDGVPATLTTRMLSAFQPDDRGPVHAMVRQAADRLIADAIANPAAGDAGGLLAADALITYVCEAVSERDPAALARLS